MRVLDRARPAASPHTAAAYLFQPLSLEVFHQLEGIVTRYDAETKEA